MPDDASPKQYGLCLTLGVVLGALGAHRAYVGRWVTAAAQALGTVAAGWWLIAAWRHVDLSTLRVTPILAPLGALFAWNLWPVIDVGALLAGRFRDAAGRVVRP